MSAQIKQKKYLKKYMSKEDKVKKRKHTAPIGSTRVKIIDDDVDIRKIQVENDDELILSGDEAPQIVGVTSAGSPVPRAVDNFRYSGKWKNLSGNSESGPKDSLTEKSMFSKKISEKLKLFHDGNIIGGRSHKTDISKRSKNEKNRSSISKGDSDNSPPRKPSPKHSDDSDYSPPRKNNSGKLRQSPSKYQSPPQKRRSSDDYSPPRKGDKSSNRYEAVSNKQHYNSDSDYSPKRSSSKFQDKNSDYSPKRRTNKDRSDDDYSPSRKSAKTKSLDDLPVKQSKHLGHSTKSLEKGRRSESSDYSPPRKNNDSNHGDLSPPRKVGFKQSKSSDCSPPRRSQKNSSESRSNTIRGGKNKSSRWGSRDKSPSRRSGDRSPRQQSGDRSPKRRSRDRSPRRRSRDRSPSRRSRDRSPSRRSRDRSPRRRSTERLEGETSSHSKINTETNKASFGLRKGGPDDNKKRQNPFSKDYHEDIPDKDQELMTRNRRRVPDEVKEKAREEKMKREQEKKELYSKWNRGLRQIEEYKTKAADDRKEADKPLARYANDEDLDSMLKQQERIGDPMLEYMREKQREKRKQDKVLEFPAYKGIAPENRFQIRPGYRWDGVDRSNGYEKKWFDFQSEKKANIEESYKYDEDYM